MVAGDGRRGTIRMVMRGKLPDDFKIYASEIYQDPTELNSSWIIERPGRVVSFNMSQAKSMQMNSRQKKSNNGDGKQFIFSNLFLKFESMEDCQFIAIITFPDEEELVRRKKLAE